MISILNSNHSWLLIAKNVLCLPSEGILVKIKAFWLTASKWFLFLIQIIVDCWLVKTYFFCLQMVFWLSYMEFYREAYQTYLCWRVIQSGVVLPGIVTILEISFLADIRERPELFHCVTSYRYKEAKKYILFSRRKEIFYWLVSPTLFVTFILPSSIWGLLQLFFLFSFQNWYWPHCYMALII